MAVLYSFRTSAAGSQSPAAYRRVIINLGTTGWRDDPTAPEGPYTVLGGTSTTKLASLKEMIAVPADDVELVPNHLSNEEAAALPLTGLTA